MKGPTRVETDNEFENATLELRANKSSTNLADTAFRQISLVTLKLKKSDERY